MIDFMAQGGELAMTARIVKSRMGRFFLPVVVWTSLGIAYALPDVMGGASLNGFLATLCNWWIWGLMTPIVQAFDRRLPLTDSQLGLRLLKLAAFGIAVTPVYVVVASTVEYSLGLNSWPPLSHPMYLLGWYFWSWYIYLMIVVVLQAYRYYVAYLTRGQKVERLKRHYVEARMNALRMQMDPHFLFNTLNTISSQVEREPRLAREMIGYLGDLLRLSLISKDRQIVTLQEELTFLDPYLSIQKIRFAERLNVVLNIPSDTRSALVPSLILQPLAENAIRHGLSPKSSGGTLVLSAMRESENLILSVADDGVGLPDGWRPDRLTGIGLSATRKRIAGLYPDGVSCMHVLPRLGGGTEVRIVIPFRRDKK